MDAAIFKSLCDSQHLLRRIAASVLLAVLLSLPSLAAAREEILQFDSQIEVQSDGGIIVTEEITVRAEGREIKRGIYRELPINYIGALGDRRPAGFKLLKVDSTATGDVHFTERLGENIRIYAGQRNRRLDPGVYTYTFRYSMAHQLGHFDQYDEIYWNVTGNQWTFPINKVTARVVLPAGAKILQTAAYTGRRGATGKDFSATRISDTIAEFETTRQLAPQEGITVSVGWPKGFVAAPGTGAQTLTWLQGNSGLMALFVSALAVPWYLFSSWMRVGRDPEKGVIIPLFAPPKGLSPAAVSFVHFMALKSAGRGASKALIAALLSLAVKGRIRLSEADDEVTAELVDHRGEDLPAGERVLHSELFKGGAEFKFNEANATTFALARRVFQKAILNEHSNVHFKDNAGHFWLAMAIGAAGIAAFFILQGPTDEQIGPFIGIGVLSVFAVVLALVGFHSFRKEGFAKVVVAALVVVALGVIGLVMFSGPALGLNPAVTVPGAAFMAMVVSVAVFAQLLRAPTVSGRQTMDQIEGLKLYLSVAEAERLNMADAPDMSEKLFERLLPYAIALGVEKPWSDAFASHLARLLPDTQSSSGYTPGWYSGSNWDGRNIGRATEGMVSSMSNSMASATPASSGSGSGGGGSSGGGGGGGGGGGW